MKSRNFEIFSWQNALKKISILGLVLIISAMLYSTLIACSISSKTIFTEKQNGKSLNLKSGNEFQVKLESNQTTGYSWKLSEKTDINTVLQMSSIYETSSKDKDIAGAGGFETFTFKAVNPGQTKLILEYIRPWEKEVDPVNTYILDIKVD